MARWSKTGATAEDLRENPAARNFVVCSYFIEFRCHRFRYAKELDSRCIMQSTNLKSHGERMIDGFARTGMNATSVGDLLQSRYRNKIIRQPHLA